MQDVAEFITALASALRSGESFVVVMSSSLMLAQLRKNDAAAALIASAIRTYMSALAQGTDMDSPEDILTVLVARQSQAAAQAEGDREDRKHSFCMSVTPIFAAGAAAGIVNMALADTVKRWAIRDASDLPEQFSRLDVLNDNPNFQGDALDRVATLFSSNVASIFDFTESQDAAQVAMGIHLGLACMVAGRFLAEDAAATVEAD